VFLKREGFKINSKEGYKIFNVIDVYSRKAFKSVVDFSFPGKVRGKIGHILLERNY